MKRIYPGGVKYLVFLILLIGVWNLIRLLVTISIWNLLSEYHINGGPLFIGISGTIWAVVAFYIGYCVVHAKPWSWGMIWGFLTGYAIWTLFDQLGLQAARNNQYFVLFLTFLWLVLSGIILSSQKVRDFFHEQSKEN